jgi:hypothetical protein
MVVRLRAFLGHEAPRTRGAPGTMPSCNGREHYPGLTEVFYSPKLQRRDFGEPWWLVLELDV